MLKLSTIIAQRAVNGGLGVCIQRARARPGILTAGASLLLRLIVERELYLDLSTRMTGDSCERQEDSGICFTLFGVS